MGCNTCIDVYTLIDSFPLTNTTTTSQQVEKSSESESESEADQYSITVSQYCDDIIRQYHLF